MSVGICSLGYVQLVYLLPIIPNEVFCVFSERINGDDGLQDECQIRGVKVLESDNLESGNQGKFLLKKNVAKAELPPTVSEKDSLQAKSRLQTVKSRQTQSGPLMPGIVVGQSIPDRLRNSERCITIH